MMPPSLHHPNLVVREHPGMAVLVRYRQLCGIEERSEFYPVRFSRVKASDSNPQLGPSEYTYLQQQVQTRSLVIFQEDEHTGETAHIALDYFGTLFPGKVAGYVTNAVSKG
jgi:hypothetical protein